MIHLEIDSKIQPALGKLQLEAATIDAEIERLRDATRTEDSISKKGEMANKIKGLRQRQRSVWNEMDEMRTKAFKSLLKKEYGLEDNPKFELAYKIAYEEGHSSGYSEIENYFAPLVDLIK